MSREDLVACSGVVVEVLANATFRVKLNDYKTNDGKDYIILATLSGKMRMNNINVILHDRVDLEMSPYDLTRGRIVRRHKS